MKAVKEEPAWVAKLSDSIDAGRFEEAERMLLTLGANTDPLVALAEAEVNLYFCRFERARELLSQITPWKLDARSLSRYLLVLGQLHLEHGQWDAAEEALKGACCIFKLVGARCHVARGLYYLGEVRLRRGQGEEAEAIWEQAKELLAGEETARGDYVRGLLDYALGVWRFHKGQMEEARASLHASLTFLEEERGRYYASALGALGAVLVSCGQCAEALEPLRDARRILARYALGDSLSDVTETLARALVRMGCFAEAEHALRESLEVLERLGHRRGVGRMFQALADAYFEQNDLSRAEQSARLALEQASALCDERLQAEAHLLLGRAAARRRDPEAAERALVLARDIARSLGDRKLEGLACLYLGEACYAISPMRAHELIANAQELLRPVADPQLEREIERVLQRAAGERIKLTPDNKLIFDGNFLPNWYVARETLERFLLKNALRQAEGNLTKAGELLGITKVHVHNLRRQFNL